MIEIRNVAVGMKQAVALVGMRMVRAARVGILVFVILAIALSTGSCKHEPSSVASGTTNNAQGGALSSGSGSAHVNYKSNVHLVEQDEGEKGIFGVSTNGAALLLDPSNPKFQSLKGGDVLVIKGMMAKKIVATKMDESGLLVLTQQAQLTDAVQDGTIHVSAPIRFGGQVAENRKPELMEEFMNRFSPTVYAQSPDALAMNSAEAKGTKDAYGNVLSGVKGALIDDWKTDFNATTAEGKINIHLKMTKEVGGFKAVITGEGYLANFDFDSNIGIEQSKFDNIDAGLKNLNGVMNFKWEVAKETPGVQTGDDRIKLPAAIEIPLYKYMDGFPLFLEIGSALIIKPAISGGKEYSRGSFRITYDGYQHFSAKKGNIDSDGNITGDIQFLESQNISPLAPMGMVVAFAAPRIELTFGVSKILKFKDMKEAASKVDALAGLLAKEALTPEQYAAFKSSPMGNFTISKAIENATKSDAAVYFEFISSAGMSFTGISAITPCTRHDIHLWGRVGVSAEVFGQSMGKSEKDIFEKDFTRIDPPGTKLCEAVGPKV